MYTNNHKPHTNHTPNLQDTELCTGTIISYMMNGTIKESVIVKIEIEIDPRYPQFTVCIENINSFVSRNENVIYSLENGERIYGNKLVFNYINKVN